MAKVLIIGASGRIGSKIIKELDKNSKGIDVFLGTSQAQVAEKWKNEGRNAQVFDLNNPKDFSANLKGVDRLFLLTGYTSDMLYQSKMMVDAAKEARVKHLVHLGVYSSKRDPIPHFTWHDLVESYIASSGIPWTNIHPNVITESVLLNDALPPIAETNSISIMSGDAPQGWVCTDDIAAVAATVLREGPSKHAEKDYYLSIEVLRAQQVANIISEVTGREIKCNFIEKAQQEAMFEQIPSVPIRTYMESAVITMELTKSEKFAAQNQINDDVMTVVGRPGTSMKEWAKKYLL